MYPRFSCLVPLVYLLSQVVSLVSVFLGYPFLNVSSVFLFGPFRLLTFSGCVFMSVFLGYPFLNVPSVFLFGPFSLLTFTGCVLGVRVSGLSVLECTLGFPGTFKNR
jgi:hypothetical protein